MFFQATTFWLETYLGLLCLQLQSTHSWSLNKVVNSWFVLLRKSSFVVAMASNCNITFGLLSILILAVVIDGKWKSTRYLICRQKGLLNFLGYLMATSAWSDKKLFNLLFVTPQMVGLYTRFSPSNHLSIKLECF